MGFYGNLKSIAANTEKILNEGTVYKGDRMSVGVFPDTGRNFGEVAYFKVYYGSDYNKSTKVARIRFTEPKYEIHSGDGKENWKLNSSEKKQLMKILCSPANNGQISKTNSNISVWDALRMEFERITNINVQILNIPDYTKL